MVNIEITESYDHYSGGYEYDVETKLTGYLDKDFKLITLEK